MEQCLTNNETDVAIDEPPALPHSDYSPLKPNQSDSLTFQPCNSTFLSKNNHQETFQRLVYGLTAGLNSAETQPPTSSTLPSVKSFLKII